MTDEIKSDAEQTLSDVKATIGTLSAEEKKSIVWIKNHTLWLVGFVCLMIGILIGHALTIHH